MLQSNWSVKCGAFRLNMKNPDAFNLPGRKATWLEGVIAIFTASWPKKN